MPSFIDLKGKVFGKLTVLSLSNKRGKNNTLHWLCKCECGNVIEVSGSNLRSGNTTSCYCSRNIDLTNQRFFRLLVINKFNEKDNRGNTLWECICDCGNKVRIPTSSLISNNTKSCGCYLHDIVVDRNKTNSTHGLSRTPIYQAWNAMIQRCNNPMSDNWIFYGGRGITVCDRWLNSFENFYVDMGDKPGTEYSIDRINTNGNYEPGNCRWATNEEQQNNRRNNVKYNYKNELLTIPELSRKYNINENMLYYRINNGWTINNAIETPSRRKEPICKMKMP